MTSTSEVGRIYLITNTVNGKVYVGQTVQALKKRWRQHVGDARRGVARPLYEAIRTLGKHSFTIHELERCLVENLSGAEARWIAHHASADPAWGYNRTGGGGQAYTKEAREKLAEKTRVAWADPDLRSRQSVRLQEVNRDPEYLDQKRAATKEAWADPFTRAKYIEAANDPVRKEAKAKAVREQWRDPAIRERHRSSLTPEVKSRIAASIATTLADPEVKGRQSAGVKKAFEDPERKARQAKRMWEVMADPREKARRGEAIKKALAERKARLAAERATAETTQPLPDDTDKD